MATPRIFADRRLTSACAPSNVGINIRLRRRAPGLICAKTLGLTNNILSNLTRRLSRRPRLDVSPRHAVIGVDSPRVEITQRPASIDHGVIPAGDQTVGDFAMSSRPSVGNGADVGQGVDGNEVCRIAGPADRGAKVGGAHRGDLG